MPLAIIVTGGRSFSDAQFVFDTLSGLDYDRGPILIVLEGGATGADRHASNWAAANKKTHMRYDAKWDLHGRSAAGPIRNQEMLDALLCLEHCTKLVVAFPSETMNQGRGGTLDMISRAEAANIPVLKATPGNNT